MNHSIITTEPFDVRTTRSLQSKTFRPEMLDEEFLSKMWSIFENPNSILEYDGWGYQLKDTETECFIDAGLSSSGLKITVFGEDLTQIDRSLSKMQTLIQNASFVDCQIQLEAEYGSHTIGCKNGVPFHSGSSYEDLENELNAEFGDEFDF